MKLNEQEELLYNKITYNLSGSINEISQDDLKNTLLNVKNNWKNWSVGMLSSLILNPTNAEAINKYLPQTYKEIKSVVDGNAKTIDFSKNFSSGQTSLENSPELIQNIQELKNYIKNKKLSKYKIKIIASESQVPNQSPYKNPGSLAAARASVIKNIVNKLGLDNIEIITQIGNTPYKSGIDNPKDVKYENDQFVKLEISINTKDICNFQDFKKGGGVGTESNDYITYEEDISGDGYIELKTGSIPDRIIILDSEGKITKDSGFITTENHNYPEWNYVPLYIFQLTKVYNDKNSSVSGSKIKTIKVNTFEDLLNHMLIKPNSYKSNKFKETGLAVNELQKLFDSGVREFVLYDKVPSPYKMVFEESKNDVSIRVYSPVSQTGFELKGSCKVGF